MQAIFTPEQVKAIADYHAALRAANIVERHYKANKTPENEAAYWMTETNVTRTNQVLIDLSIG